MNKDKRSKYLVVAALSRGGLLLGTAAVAATHAAYPTRPVRLIVGFAPGGSDVPGRMLALRLSEKFGQTFVIDNRPGAASILGTELAAKAQPDGYTLIFSTASHAVTAVAYKKLPYDPIRDFTPISRVGSVPFALVTHPSFPATTLKEFIAVAKQKPGQLNYPTPGAGSIGHLAVVLFLKQAGLAAQQVSYKGTGPAVAAILSGETQFGMPNLVGALPQVKAGKLRALAVATATRSPLAPDIPTFAEGGVTGVEAGTWYGVNAPRGVPRPVVDRLNHEIVDALKSQSLRDQFATVGVVAEPSTPEEFAAFIKSEIEKWGGVMKFAGMKAESF
jgi:tripartite-type tricarboxylate transporter receptor subunit TctC